jgi:menaquinone-dependent protoporphyrinogen oxidase
MKVLIAYGTTDGQTTKIAERLAETARSHGHDVTILPTKRAPRDLDVHGFDAVLVGASLHAGGFQRSTRRFIRKHIDALRTRPSAFFGVCLAIASKNPEEHEEVRRIAARFPASCGWLTDTIEIFAGALMFSRYGFLRRHALIRIARKELGSIDPSRDHIYTDWEQVERFAVSFLGTAAQNAAAAA